MAKILSSIKMIGKTIFLLFEILLDRKNINCFHLLFFSIISQLFINNNSRRSDNISVDINISRCSLQTGTRPYPWNYTLPDLVTFINASELPSVHDLLGLTTTTTQVSNVNKPIFPLNLTFWSANMPWKMNISSNLEEFSESDVPGNGNDDDDDQTALLDSHPSPNGYYSGSSATGTGYGFSVPSVGRMLHTPAAHDVAQMVVPAGIGTYFQHTTPSFASLNISFVNQDSTWFVEDNILLSTERTSENATDSNMNGVAMSTAGMIATSVILGIMILTTVIG